MLILTRTVGERIVLPDTGITIEVVKINNRRVRVGISAPANVAIHREEVWNRIVKQESAADRPRCRWR